MSDNENAYVPPPSNEELDQEREILRRTLEPYLSPPAKIALSMFEAHVAKYGLPVKCENCNALSYRVHMGSDKLCFRCKRNIDTEDMQERGHAAARIQGMLSAFPGSASVELRRCAERLRFAPHVLAEEDLKR